MLPNELPDEVIRQASEKYIEIYERIFEKKYIKCQLETQTRIYHHLVKEKIIKDGFVSLVMGSPSDIEHVKKIRDVINKYDIYTELRVVSAHKNGERIPEIVENLNRSLEPGSVIAVAGRSNGLGGALAANLTIPLINCPPFKDKIDMMVNINSSLMMPSKTPAMTVIDVSSAALAALRSLNLRRLKDVFIDEIKEMKESLIKADEEIQF